MRNISIKQWASADRPREKLLMKGKAALSDAELIALLMGSGTRDKTAVDLARELLSDAKHLINELAQWDIPDFTRYTGIGEAKAVSIVAALELGRRRSQQPLPKNARITSSVDAADLMRPRLMDAPHEQFWVILLSRSHRVKREIQISSGGVSGTVVDPKIIFKHALQELASALIMVHNHPSGNTRPSEADKKLTKKMTEAGKLLEISVLDHIIFTNEAYFSFADEGLI